MVRFANEDDFNFVKNSWSTCFDDSKAFINWNFEYNYSAENTVIAEAEGKSASVMQLMPYAMVVNGKSFSIRYVSGVATMPDYRGRGLVRKLFEFGLPNMYSMGADISILVPAVDGMYEKFGYRKILSRTLFKINDLGEYKRVSEISDELIDRLDSIYKKEVSKKSVYIDRCYGDWVKILTDLIELSKGLVLLSDNGYALVYPKDDGFEMCEGFGDIRLDGEEISFAPVMARIINAKSVAKRLGISNPSVSDELIAENNMGSDEAKMDIAEFTELVFDKILKDNSDGYINLLL